MPSSKGDKPKPPIKPDREQQGKVTKEIHPPKRPEPPPIRPDREQMGYIEETDGRPERVVTEDGHGD